MEEILKEVISTYLIPAVITLVGAFITYIGTRIKAIYEAKMKSEETRKIVDNVVAFIERTAKTEENNIKYNMALEKASEWLATKGIVVDGTELALLIEASVNKLPKTNKEE